MGKVVSGITGALGLTADTSAGAGASRGAQELEQRAVRELEKLDIPEIEKQRLALEIPKLVGLLETEQLSPSRLEELDMDPQLRDNILQAIASEKEFAEQGLTAEDRMRRDALLRAARGDEQARQASIRQEMAERCMGGGGSELAARLLSSQSGADRARQEAMNLAAQASQNRRQAAQNVANMSSQLDATQFARDAQKASAADEIARFNAMNRQNVNQANLAAQQAIANQGTNTRNQQQMANKGLYQQQFQNQMAKATGITNQLQNQAQGMYNQANREAQAAQAQAAGTRSLLGSGIAAFAMSDKKAKKNVRDAKSDEFKDMLDKIKPKKYDYKEGGTGAISDTDYTGVMAQDLEKSDLGRDMVMDTPEGKMVDKEKMLMTAMASLADMNDRVKELESGKGKPEVNDSARMSNDKPSPEAGDSRIEELNQLLDAIRSMQMPNKYNDGGVLGLDALRAAQGEYEQKLVDDEKMKNRLMGVAKALQGSDQVPQATPQAPRKTMDDPMKYLRGQFADGGMESPASYTEGGERVDELLDEGELSINPSAQEELMDFLRGNIEAEDMDEGRIIEGDSFSGDLLPDRINSGELVANVGQQQRMKDKLMDQEAKARGFNKLLDMLGKK